VRAVDPRTLEVTLEHRQSFILFSLGGAPFEPVPRSVVERFGGGTRPGSLWSRPGNIVSNGAFMLASWHPNQDLVVVRNPHYWDRAHVRLREIHFYPTDDAESEELAFRSGQLHVTYSLPTSKIAVYRQHSKSLLHISPLLQTSYLCFNTKRSPFGDARIRRALSIAIDRDQIVPLVRHESATPAHSLTRPGTAGYSPPGVADYDPDLARRLLAEAGYPGGAGFPAVELKVTGSQNRVFAEALQQVWQKELGVTVAIASEEQKTLFSDGNTGNFQVMETGYFYGINAPETILLVMKGDSPQNYTGWNDPAYEIAYKRASEADTEVERRAAFDEMERILFLQAPVAPLYFINQPFLVSDQVKGWRDNSIGQIDWRELSLSP
jgi:oligopeptide transport system substrate-binding protein